MVTILFALLGGGCMLMRLDFAGILFLTMSGIFTFLIALFIIFKVINY